MAWRVDPWRLFHIGDFFTDLAREILGGEKTAGSHDSGDIDNWDLDVQIEVKARGNKNVLNIYSRQLDSQAELIGFPFGQLWYAIFFYRNHWRDKKRSMAKETPTRKSLDLFLNKNILCGYVVDSRVLLAIRDSGGVKSAERTGESVDAIRVNKKTLQGFVGKPKSIFKKYKLRGFGVLKLKIRMQFRGSMAEFDLVLILPNKQLEKIFQLNLGLTSETREDAETPVAQEPLL